MIKYHITTQSGLGSILETGIEPRLGERAKARGETQSAVHLFNSLAEVDTAIIDWVTEQMDEGNQDELVVLAVNLVVPDNVAQSDFKVLDLIPVTSINTILDEDLEEISLSKARTRWLK